MAAARGLTAAGVMVAGALTAPTFWAGEGGQPPPGGFSPGVVIPAGPVTLGSDEKEKAFGYSIGGAAARKFRWFDDEPSRRVTVPAFWIEQTLVSLAQYERFVTATGHRPPFISRKDYREQGFLVHPYSQVVPFLRLYSGAGGPFADYPVSLVSVADAKAYCGWRGKKERRSCRLPSENEWEKAARGTDGRYFPWGNRWEPERLNSEEAGPYWPTPVRKYPQGRSPHGLYDMAGNLFQWTATPGAPGKNILKGCSWDDAAGICRSAARHGRKAESRHILIGFRCACDLSPNGKP